VLVAARAVRVDPVATDVVVPVVDPVEIIADRVAIKVITAVVKVAATMRMLHLISISALWI
jgi:hypothetical protein